MRMAAQQFRILRRGHILQREVTGLFGTGGSVFFGGDDKIEGVEIRLGNASGNQFAVAGTGVATEIVTSTSGAGTNIIVGDAVKAMTNQLTAPLTVSGTSADTLTFTSGGKSQLTLARDVYGRGTGAFGETPTAASTVTFTGIGKTVVNLGGEADTVTVNGTTGNVDIRTNGGDDRVTINRADGDIIEGDFNEVKPDIKRVERIEP